MKRPHASALFLTIASLISGANASGAERHETLQERVNTLIEEGERGSREQHGRPLVEYSRSRESESGITVTQTVVAPEGKRPDSGLNNLETVIEVPYGMKLTLYDTGADGFNPSDILDKAIFTYTDSTRSSSYEWHWDTTDGTRRILMSQDGDHWIYNGLDAEQDEINAWLKTGHLFFNKYLNGEEIEPFSKKELLSYLGPAALHVAGSIIRGGDTAELLKNAYNAIPLDTEEQRERFLATILEYGPTLAPQYFNNKGVNDPTRTEFPLEPIAFDDALMPLHNYLTNLVLQEK
jgi:hypothetical protein